MQVVPKGQYEAGRSLGMSHTRAMITIVIPQAIRIILPPLTNEIIMMTKDSSLIYLLGLTASQYELAKFGREAISSPDAGLTALVIAGAAYLVIPVPLGTLARRFRSRTAKLSRTSGGTMDTTPPPVIRTTRQPGRTRHPHKERP